MNLILRVLKPFGLHDDHEVGEFVPAPLREVNKLVRDGYAEIVINNRGNNKEYNEHYINGQLVPEWIKSVSPEPVIEVPIAPMSPLEEVKEPRADLSTNCGICNENMDMSHCALHRAEKDGSITSYHGHHEGQLKGLKPCEDCGHHRVFCNECKESE